MSLFFVFTPHSKHGPIDKAFAMPFLLRTFSTHTAIVSSLLQPVQAIHRTIGPPLDPDFSAASANCGGNIPESYKYGHCGALLRCVLDYVKSDTSAGSQSGANIASLVPTAMSLIGVPPLEIVQLALYAPHRAIAICMFGIGLPTNLFRQLQPTRDEKSGKNVDNDKERSLDLLVEPFGSPVSVLKRICGDVAIVGLASVMLWRNWVVGTMIMITWRCEYSLLLFGWPMACLAWLVVAMICLVVFKESIEVTYSEDDENEKRRLVDPFLSRYYAPRRKNGQPVHQDAKDGSSEALEMLAIPSTSSANPVDTARTRVRGDPNAVSAKSIMKITIRMKSNRGLQSWQGYEALLETLAVGIYLYATFVLTSALFFTGEEAITYASAMILCLTVIRLVGI